MALGNWSSLIKKFFVQDKPNKAGVYSVNGWVGGKQKEITVDDQFPFIEGSFFGGTGNNGKVWNAIVHKAWAKVNYNYEKMKESSASEVVYFITGIPSYDF